MYTKGYFGRFKGLHMKASPFFSMPALCEISTYLRIRCCWGGDSEILALNEGGNVMITSFGLVLYTYYENVLVKEKKKKKNCE